MGAFFLELKSSESGHRYDIERGLDVFAAKGLKLNHKIENERFSVHVYDKIAGPIKNYFAGPMGDFACGTGTYIYKGRTGSAALEMLLEDWTPEGVLPEQVLGDFCFLFFKGGSLYLNNAESGLYHVFRDAAGSVYSSSFLALCRALPEISLSDQGFFEYVLNGAVYGDATLVDEISLVDPRAIWKLDTSRGRIERPSRQVVGFMRKNFSRGVEEVSSALVEYFGEVKKVFDSDVCSALSGGYDSRLMLGLMREVGITPYLYVYGSDSSKDVKVAKTIARGLDIQLDHINRDDFPELEPEEYSEQLKKQFFLGDGLTNTGVFDNGSTLATRLERVSKARLQLNGGGGEIYRNFWTLPDQKFSPSSFLKSKYDRFDPVLFHSRFDKRSYFAELEKKIRSILQVEMGKLTRQQVEMLYPFFRLRYWMGMNNSHNAQFAYSLTPFSESHLVYQSFGLPLAWKNEGRFEAAIIKNLDRKLAAFPSCYGYSFSDAVPFKRKVKGALVRNTPVPLRPFLRKRVHKKGEFHDTSFPYFLDGKFLESLGIKRPLKVEELVDLEMVNNPNLMSRILSVELILSGYPDSRQ
jgi:hypothetical protein